MPAAVDSNYDAHQISNLFISHHEAEFLASSLRVLRPEDVGTSLWLEQHEALEALNLQAHSDVHSHREEYVKDALVAKDRVSTLVIDLLVAEAWMERAFPLLREHIVTNLDSVLAFSLVHRESMVASLLEIVLHHQDAAQALTDEAALELCDWCARKIAYLDTDARALAKQVAKSPRALLDQSPQEELQARADEQQLTAALSALAILRHMTDHADHLPLSAIHRIVATNGGAATIVPLVLRPPWERRAGAGKGWERWEGGCWVSVPPEQSRCLGSADAQAWLLLHNLLLHPAAAAKLELDNEHAVDPLLSLRPKMTAALVDQLPVLAGVQRFLDALAMGAHAGCAGAEGAAAAAAAKVVIEQPPRLREALLKQINWKALAEEQRMGQFAPTTVGSTAQDRAKRFLETVDFLFDSGLDSAEHRAPAVQPTVKIDAYYEAGQGRWVWGGTYRYDVCMDDSESIQVAVPPEKRTCNGLKTAIHQASETGIDNETVHVAGKRYRLKPKPRSMGMKALPPRGKAVVSFGEQRCEALYELPVSPTR